MESLRNLKRKLSVTTGADSEGSETSFASEVGYGQRVSPRLLTPSLSALSFSFNDADLLESGGAREYLTEALISPHSHKRIFLKCHVRRQGKDKFFMYRDSDGTFMLSAKLVNGNFYISQYANFPDVFERERRLSKSPRVQEKRGASYCNVLRLNRQKQYELYSRSCEACDDVLGRLTCGPDSLLNGDRQQLAQISHSVAPVAAGGETINCNVVRIMLPFVYPDLSRDVWCPRFKRRSVAGDSEDSVTIARRGSASSIASLEPTYTASIPTTTPVPAPAPAPPGTKSRIARSTSAPETTRAAQANQQPVVLGRSRGRRVGASTSKQQRSERSGSSVKLSTPVRHGGDGESAPTPNAIPALKRSLSYEPAVAVASPDTLEQQEMLVDTKRPRYDASTGSLRMKFFDNRVRLASSKNLIFCLSDGDSERGVLQFGKAAQDRYNMDFRFPLAPVQAFAACISLFCWQGPKTD